MTFKHIKFEDSPIMRSLEKVAKEKGLVKEPTVLEKIASRPAVKKVDTTPSSSMMDNIFKLCAGMRKQGLVKEAAELESNYFNYKQAQTLYEAHKETGEDVIQFAHPKGSHRLEGVEGDEATVEDILDKHVKFLNMVEKKPTGKLSSSAHVLSEVKKALGEDATDKNTGLTQPVINYIMSIFKNIDEDLSSNWNWFTGMSQDGILAYNRLRANFIKYMNNKTISMATLGSIIGTIDEAIKGFSSRDAERLFYISDEAEKITFQLKSLKNYINDTVIDDHKSLMSTVQSDPILDKGVDLVNRLNAAKSIKNVAKNPEALKWITDEISEIKDVVSRFNSANNTGQIEQVRADLQNEMNEKEKEVNDFYSQVRGQPKA